MLAIIQFVILKQKNIGNILVKMQQIFDYFELKKIK